MHPFSLNTEEIEQVSGGALHDGLSNLLLEGGQIDPISVPAKEDGRETTLALGEEGGLPPEYLA
ncbi:hypothetical protein GTP41_15055 [Pseudoduganella sp. DS3]|uniref:Uncharacterized protein n=1 Tax=Pseudoduganella guangdongensis TaxID=2692179 RepID=A0A6N9HJS1_9BURK|nr:hypothetical protein [Pseudoduganella guangdongensis]MYN03413.1 hypothetical protein [Pseudoduganella guangdongensis]